MAKKQTLQAPLWGQDLIDRYKSAVAHAFFISGNVQDYVGARPGQTLKNYLFLSFAGRAEDQDDEPEEQKKQEKTPFDIVVYWNRADGFFFPKKEMKQLFAEVMGLTALAAPVTHARGGLGASMNATSPSGAESDPLLGVEQTKPVVALKMLSKLLRTRMLRPQPKHKKDFLRFAVILDYVETITPPQSDADDRTVLVFLEEMGRDSRIGETGHIAVAITSNLHDVNETLRRSGARWEQIEIPFPSFEERATFIELLLNDKLYEDVKLAEGLTYKDIARLTTGLRYIDLEDIVLRASYHKAPLSLPLVKERKDQIVASEFNDVLQIVENEYGFEALGGMEEVKADLRENIVAPMRLGNYRIVPQGVLLMGPAGTGKTKITKALAKESGVTFVELQPSKIFSKWVGDTERRLERALTAIKAMTPCIVFIDEIDQAVGRGENSDNGVSNRVFKRLMEIMSDTTWRGKILWVGASNRPDLLDAALLRPGRFDKKIPILAPDEKERAVILRVLTTQAFPGDPSQHYVFPSQEHYESMARQMENYTGAEIEAVVGKAVQLYNRFKGAWGISKCLLEAFDRMIPSTQNIEQMTRLALLHCNDLDLVPEELRHIAKEVRKPKPVPSVEEEDELSYMDMGRRSPRSDF